MWLASILLDIKPQSLIEFTVIHFLKPVRELGQTMTEWSSVQDGIAERLELGAEPLLEGIRLRPFSSGCMTDNGSLRAPTLTLTPTLVLVLVLVLRGS